MNKILFQQLETLKSESPVQNAVIDETIKMIKQLKAELDELKKQPEPTEFTKRIRWLIKDIDLGYQPRGMVEITKEDILEACDIIDQQAKENKELKEHLIDITNQSCLGQDGKLDSMALSTNADAMRLLAKYGEIIIEKEYGRRVIGHWSKP